MKDAEMDNSDDDPYGYGGPNTVFYRPMPREY